MQMENLVLVGMPGCGKSTIGKILAKELGKDFVDADSEIIQEAGMPIPQIFAESGEEGFRKIETKVLSHIGAKSGLVVATGGGCVTRNENYQHLHRNGTIVWIKRDLNQLPTEGRPLSQAGTLDKMYKIRQPLYEQFADIIVENDCTKDEVVNRIISRLTEV